MPKSIYVQYLAEQPNSNSHFLNRLIKTLNHFISIEPPKKPKGYESHHIVPRSWKPEWEFEKNNLLKVPAKAHYVIHHLMWKAFPKNHQMKWSFWKTCYGQQKQKITAKVYESLKSNLSHSEETKQKMREKHKRQKVFATFRRNQTKNQSGNETEKYHQLGGRPSPFRRRFSI